MFFFPALLPFPLLYVQSSAPSLYTIVLLARTPCVFTNPPHYTAVRAAYSFSSIIIYNGIHLVGSTYAALSSVLMFVVVDEINDHPAYCRVRCLRAVVCTCVSIVCQCNALNSAKIYIHSGPFLLVFLPSSFYFIFFLFFFMLSI